MNGIEEYRRIVHELCEYTGMSPWEEVADAQHIEVDGATVGILVDQGRDTCSLCLYFDLGMEALPDLHRRLLEANLAIEQEEPGYFGSHPETDAVVYRVNLPLTRETSGVELALQIQDSLGAGREKLALLMSGRSFPAIPIGEANGAILAV